MIRLESHAEGVVLSVRAQPGARSEGVRGSHAGMLKVSVTQVAEKGKANQSIVEVLCKNLRLKRSQVELLAGATNANKRFLIREIAADELLNRVHQALP